MIACNKIKSIFVQDYHTWWRQSATLPADRRAGHNISSAFLITQHPMNKNTPQYKIPWKRLWTVGVFSADKSWCGLLSEWGSPSARPGQEEMSRDEWKDRRAKDRDATEIWCFDSNKIVLKRGGCARLGVVRVWVIHSAAIMPISHEEGTLFHNSRDILY